MKIVVVKELAKLGKTGEIKTVADGYARNFLIPFGFAIPATESNLKTREEIMAREARREAAEQGEYSVLAEKLKSQPLRFAIKLGQRGKAFGSISAQDIAEELAKQGVSIDKRWIELENPIKTTGEHAVPIKLPREISAELRIVVEAEK